MTRRHMGLCALVCGLACGAWQIAFAQQPGTVKPTRPDPLMLRKADPPDPKLEGLLKAWEQESAKIVTLAGKHRRSEANSVFEVETITEGKFFFEAPDKGRIDMEGVKLKPTDVSRRKSPKDGTTPFRMQPGHAERWICNGVKVLQIDDRAKQVETIPIPQEFQGKNIIHSPLPFLFGMKADEAKKRFQFKIIPIAGDKTYYLLQVTPLTGQDAFSKAMLALDKQLFVPIGVVLTDFAGESEIRYDFSEIKINDRSIGKWVGELFGKDPFNPNLSGYKVVQTPVVQPAGGEAPPGQKISIQPSSLRQPAPIPKVPTRVPAPPTKSAIR